MIEENNRESENSYINVLIDLSPNIPFENKDIYLDKNKVLDVEIKKFLKDNNIKIEEEYYLYLKINGEITKELDKKKTVFKLGLKPNDEILISKRKKIDRKKRIVIKEDLSFNDDPVLDVNKIQTKKKRNIHNNNSKFQTEFYNKYTVKSENRLIHNIPKNEEKKLKKKNKIIIITIAILGLLFIGVGLFFFLKFIKKRKNKSLELESESMFNKVYKEEVLATKINYNIDYLLRYFNEKTMKIEMESDEVDENEGTKSVNKSSDFIFIVREKHIENDDIKLIKKLWFTGYISFLNVIVNNGTNETLIMYDKDLNLHLSNNNLSVLNEKAFNQIDEEGKMCFAKIDFYENGDIKNIYYPNGLSTSNIDNIKEAIELIIPKISKNLFVDNITDFLNSPDPMVLNNLRNLSQNNKYEKLKKIRYKVAFNNNLNNRNRKLSNDSINETVNNASDYMYIEEYLSSPLTPSSKLDLREINNITDGETDSGNQNLTRFSHQNVESDLAKLEGSSKKSSVYTTINEDGLIQSIQQIEETEMTNEYNSDLEEQEINNQIYNEDNQIPLYQIEGISSNDNQDIKFNISKLGIKTINLVNLTENFTNENLTKSLYNYFDSFDYKLENQQNLTYLRMLKEKDEFIKSNNLIELSLDSENEDSNDINVGRRELERIESYYGIKKLIYKRELYRYNLIGLILKGDLYSEIDPSLGTAKTYIISNYGNKKKEYGFPPLRTNLHIIIERTNQMTYNLIKILNQLNNNIDERNKKYNDIILNYENKAIELFEKYYDYSKLFDKDLENLYHQISSFSSDTFKELLILINNAYSKYLKILEDVKIGQYNVFKIIRDSIRNDYIEFIKIMNNLLIKFCSDTILFLDNIQIEMSKIEDFTIDFFYDIIDAINDGKMILNEFTLKLFTSVEKGFLILKKNINNNAEKNIGELLYITDFLSINLNKNELLKKSFEDDVRKELSFKLDEFRNIVNFIINLLIDNINIDYSKEISDNNSNGIKLITNKLVFKNLDIIQNKENEFIKASEKKIQFLDLYELYNSNLEVINNITNKTIMENIDDSYKNILLQSMKIEPEYLNDNSDIISKKNSLFNITSSIINEVNQKNIEMNNYIENYTKYYYENNFYNLQYNIFNIKKYFMDEEMNKLFKEFANLINYTIKTKLKNMFYKNYELAMQALDEENSLFDSKCNILWWKNLYMGSSFRDKFYNYTNITTQLYESSLSDLPNFAVYCFEKIKTDIENKVKNKINSLQKYYFNDKLYKEYFITFENIKNDILNSLFDQIKFEDKSIQIEMDSTSIINNEIGNIFQSLTNSTINYFAKTLSRATQDVMDTESDFVYRFYVIFTFNEYYSIEHKNYTDELERNLTNIKNYILTETNNIIKRHINKFDKYLTNYTKIIQDLYSYLYNNINSEINNLDNIKYLANNYKLLFSDIISNNSNYKLLENLYNNSIPNISLYFTNIENNINLIHEDYFKLYYLKDHDKFIEFPEEIIFKINQFMNELNITLKSIKNNINTIYRNKITNVIQSTNQFIENFHENNFKYIEQNINKSSMIYLYITPRYNYINTLFKNCKTIYKSSINDSYKESKQNSYLKINNNDFILNDDNYNDNIALILKNYSNYILYLQEIIEENFNNQSYKNNDLNYSNYNFIVSKLRRGLYYTKSLIKNIKDTLNNLQYDIILNTTIINIYDGIVNEKDIMNLYKSSIYKLNNINEGNMNYMKYYIEEFSNDIKNYYNFNNDILPFINDFKDIIKFDNDDFLNNITYDNNQTLYYLYNLLDEFNNTLYDQLIYNDNIYYNLSFEFNKLYNESYNYIENSFNDYKNKIKAFKDNNTLHLIFRNYLRTLQDEKRNYFKEIINEVANNYNLELLNITINLGEYIESIMKKEYEEEELKYEYLYIDIYENSDIFINNISSIISSLKNKVQNKLKDIYNIYNRILINESNKIPKMNNNNSLDSKIIIQDFDVEHKKKLDNTIKKIKSIITSSYLDENYLSNYIAKCFKLQDYRIDINELSFHFKNIEEEIGSKRNKADKEYKEFLINLLKDSFYNSYYNFSNHFLKQQIANNINISINYKIGVLIDYITEKIKKEYIYYTLLLNSTDDLGITSKIAVNNLYLDFYNNLNDIFNEFLENIFDLNLPLFYQEIKNSFINNFLNYYYKEENEYDIKIFNLNKYFKEIILSDSFNNSLNSLSDKIINKVINEEIKQTINNLINTKIKSLKELINDISKDILKILNNKFEKSINDNMTIINNLVEEYNRIIKNQSKKYIFEPNDNLTNLSDDFFINILGPPLYIIKEKYNAIETDLLNELIKLINEFPDFCTIIKNNINITDKFEILGDIFNEIKNNLTAYGDELNED